MAALLANMQSPPDKIVDNKCILIKESDLSKLSSKQLVDRVNQAEKMMDQARVMCETRDIVHSVQMEILCKHDTRLVCQLLRKGKASKECKDYPDLPSAGQPFVDGLSLLTNSSVDNPWKPRTSEEGTDPTPAQVDRGKGRGQRGSH